MSVIDGAGPLLMAEVHKRVLRIAHAVRGSDDGDDQRHMLDEVTERMRELDASLVYDLQLPLDLADEFVGRHHDYFDRVLTELLVGFQQMPPAIGHDRIHLAYDMYEALQLVHDSTLSQFEQLVVLFGGICHDLGRYGEEKMFGKPMATAVHVWFSIHCVDALREQLDHEYAWTPADEELRGSFWRRVQGAVAAHFGPNAVNDSLRHYVQSADRLAGILGIRCFARNLACDMWLRGCRFWPDRDLDCAWQMAPFNNVPSEQFVGASEMKASWTNVVHYVEAPMRTCYPLVNERAERRADKLKIQAGILLMHLGGGYMKRPLASQIFAPEIECYEPKFRDQLKAVRQRPKLVDGLTRWDKHNPLSEYVWRRIESYPVHDFTGRDRELATRRRIDAFLDYNAYTMSARDRGQLRYWICDEVTKDAIAMASLLAGFGYALDEHRQSTVEESAFLRRLVKQREEHPFLATVADHIRHEPVFK